MSRTGEEEEMVREGEERKRGRDGFKDGWLDDDTPAWEFTWELSSSVPMMKRGEMNLEYNNCCHYALRWELDCTQV
jgi:hypothetical protein